MDLQAFAALTRRQKQAVAIAADFVGLPVALWLAFALRLGEIPDLSVYWPLFVLTPLVGVPVFISLGLYRQVVRYVGSHAMVAVVKGVTVCALMVATAGLMLRFNLYPRSVPVIFWLVAVIYVGGTRFLVRSYFQWLIKHPQVTEPVVIFGAGRTGVALATALRDSANFRPVGFVDQNPTLQRRTIVGLPVLRPKDLPGLLAETGARQVLVAIPSNQLEQRRAVLELLEPLAVHVRLIPDTDDVLSKGFQLTETRPVEVTDLLGRAAVAPAEDLMKGPVAGQHVMVTGAGGSIGSELCRQVLSLGPASLVLFEMSEFALYRIERELRAVAPDLAIVPVLGSVSDVELLAQTLTAHSINTLYHAAAYKHVSLVEANPIQGVVNNVMGTVNVARASERCGVQRLVLISTDKAVRPTSIMGATKRLAELAIQSLQAKGDSDCCMSIVRFGNVLNSSGSVVPLFEQQIERGGPVTVTHPDVTRYFMTIPEAVALVLQASGMATGGEVFVLDMGEPVSILALARRLIHLKGERVADDSQAGTGGISIEFTGLRAGEKLHEELLIGAVVAGTAHPKIMRAVEPFPAWPGLSQDLQRLEESCKAGDPAAVRRMAMELAHAASSTQPVALAKAGAEIKTAPVSAAVVTLDPTARRSVGSDS